MTSWYIRRKCMFAWVCKRMRGHASEISNLLSVSISWHCIQPRIHPLGKTNVLVAL